MSNNIERTRSVLYQLFSTPYGLVTIQEPVGFDNDTRGYERDADSRGFVVKTSIDLEFYGNGADYLYNLFLTYGINEKCTLTKYERDNYSLSENLKVRYIQEIDLGTLKRDSRTGKVTVNATEGGLYDDIKNRESDEYDLISETSADDINIGSIDAYTKPFKPIPRSLFLETLFKTERYQYTLFTVSRKEGITRGIRTVPLKTEYISGDIAQLPFNTNVANDNLRQSESVDLGTVEEVGNIFYWRSDLQRNLKVKFNIKYTIRNNSIFSRVTNTQFRLVLRKSKVDDNNLNDILTEKTVLQSFDPRTNLELEKTFQQTFDIPLEVGESLALGFETQGNDQSGAFSTSRIALFIDTPISEVLIEDDQDYPPTETICMKAIDVFDRVVANITGQSGLVVSSVFGQGGEYENIVIDNGLWARGFPNKYTNSNGDEQSIQMKTSFKDLFESLNYLEPLCWFTFFDGNVEKVRIEKATYTQQNFIGLDLGSVDEINSDASKPDFFSSIKIGHSESMEYEELSGLDEPNGLSEFNTFIKKTKSIYEAVSKIRTDPTGYELTRRKPYNNFPKEDTKRDDNLFMHDARLLPDGSYTHYLWNDTINGVQALDELPKGIFKPENFWNFRLTPANRLYYGHGYSVKRGLYHFPEKFVKFSSSNANQNLITKSQGVELAENGSIKVNDLKKPRVEPEKVNFTFKMTQLIEDKLLGFTRVNNELVPNYFGLIKYKENSEDRYGRLIKLETEDEAKMTVIKARL